MVAHVHVYMYMSCHVYMYNNMMYIHTLYILTLLGQDKPLTPRQLHELQACYTVHVALISVKYTHRPSSQGWARGCPIHLCVCVLHGCSLLDRGFLPFFSFSATTLATCMYMYVVCYMYSVAPIVFASVHVYTCVYTCMYTCTFAEGVVVCLEFCHLFYFFYSSCCQAVPGDRRPAFL